MSFTIFNMRDIPADARQFVAIDSNGLPYPGVEIDGVRYDRDAWRCRQSVPMPQHHTEREP